MPLIKYRDIKIRMGGLSLIKKINSIIGEYTAGGYSLTLRQVYYQMVSRDIIPNNARSYDNLGELISNGRLAGLIDWDAIEDRTRYLRRLGSWTSPEAIIAASAAQYRRNWRETQDEYVEVWVEKDALIGVIEKVAQRNDVPCFSCRGYTSQTEMWNAAQRLMWKSGAAGAADGNTLPVTIIHLGDHDPSGIDMTRDIEDRLNEFTMGAVNLKIERIALNMDQVEQYSPPPNPAKITDSRAKAYIEIHGESSWELDALNPKTLDDLIQGEIDKHTDADKLNAVKAVEAEEKARLQDAEGFVRDRDDWLNMVDEDRDGFPDKFYEEGFLHRDGLSEDEQMFLDNPKQFVREEDVVEVGAVVRYEAGKAVKGVVSGWSVKLDLEAPQNAGLKDGQKVYVRVDEVK